MMDATQRGPLVLGGKKSSPSLRCKNEECVCLRVRLLKEFQVDVEESRRDLKKNMDAFFDFPFASPLVSLQLYKRRGI